MVSISKNVEKNGIEISFAGKPDDQVLTFLKANGYRWSAFAKVWWKKFHQPSWDKAQEYFNADKSEPVQSNPEPPIIPKELNKEKAMATPIRIKASIDYSKFSTAIAAILKAAMVIYINNNDSMRESNVYSFVLDLAGPSHKKIRQQMMQELTGKKKVPIANSGVTILNTEVMKWIKENTETDIIVASIPKVDKTHSKEEPLTDRSGNYIGDGSHHVSYVVEDFSKYPQISSSLSESGSTETVYVRYFNNENGKTITVRFSDHENNAVKFGDQLDGNFASKNEIMYHLGLMNREFIPKKYLSINNRKVALKDLKNHEIADKTMKELYSLGVGADLSDYVGKVAKDGNYLILGNIVEELEDKGRDSFGNTIRRGEYVYSEPITPEQKEVWMQSRQEIEKTFEGQDTVMVDGIIKTWKQKVEKALFTINSSFEGKDSDFYKAITSGEITVGKAKSIIESAGMEVPQEILELEAGKPEPNYNKSELRQQEGFTIYLVDGEAIRKDHIKFTMGGHGLVYNWIPLNEIWIDENLFEKPQDMEATIKHELFEVKKMRDEGLDYDTAHALANEMEEKERQSKYEFFYTTAPESYDGFGTGTEEITDYVSKYGGDKPVRKIHVEPKNIDWQKGRNSSGNYITLSEKEFEDGKDMYFKKAEPIKSTLGIQPKMTSQPILDEFLPKVKIIKPFIGQQQLDSLARLYRSEEKQAAQEIADRLAGIIKSMPKTYETNNIKGDAKIVHLHYFNSGSDFYIVEKDKGDKSDPEHGVQSQAYGYTILNGDTQNAEWGYISLPELFKANVELDFYWEPKPFSEVKQKWEGKPDREFDTSKDAEIFGYDFMFDPANNDGAILMQGLQSFGLVLTDTGEAPNGIKITHRTSDYYLFDNSGEFKIDDLSVTDGYPAVVDFKEGDKLKTIKELAKEVYFLLDNQKSKKVSKPEVKDIFPELAALDISQYKNPYELNKAIEKLLDENWFKSNDFWNDKKDFISQYSGYGGLDKESFEGEGIQKGAFNEYYTPEMIIEKMWGLAYRYGYKEGAVTEPSVSIGKFFNRKYVKDYVQKTGYEINKYSAKICKILYPEANINQGKDVMNFEQVFLKNNYTIKGNVTGDQELVIGNPPYGEFSGPYMAMGEKGYTNARNWIEYFITRGLDLLKPGGLLIYIIGVEVANGGTPWLDQGTTKCKELIAQKADLIDAYRLPEGVFERTGVVSDVIVMRKK